MDKDSSTLCYQKLHNQTHNFARSTNKDCVEKVRNIDRREGPVLNEADLKAIVVMARAVEGFYNTPQDI